METKCKVAKNPLWGLVLGMFAIAILLSSTQKIEAAARQCVCHLKPSCPFDVCSAGFDQGHLNHGDPQGRCDSCGNGIRECCSTTIDDSCNDPTEVAIECCNLDTDPNEDPNHCDNNDIPGCIAEECDDGDNDCNTNGCTEDCKLTPNCDDGEDCTVDACTQDGLCTNDPKPDNDPCEEGDLCSTNDECQAGVCMPGDPLDCADELECSADSCEAGQCINNTTGCECQNDEDCADENECTIESCVNNVCQQTNAPDGDPCDDENEGTIDDHCEGGVCVACGNNEKNNNEACDGEDSSQCEDQLGCNSDCTCIEPLPPACNNGQIDPGEECGEVVDGQVFDTCDSDSPCNANTCRCAVCGNGEIGPNEECEFDSNGNPLAEPACGEDTVCSKLTCRCIVDSAVGGPGSGLQGSGAAEGSCSLNRVSQSSQGILFVLGITLMSAGIFKMRIVKRRK